LGLNSFLDQKRNKASSQSLAGTWDPPAGQPTGTTSVHAALLGDGKVLWIQGSANHHPFQLGPWVHGIWNPDGTFTQTTALDDDLFCCGMATLANGNVLLAGGTLLYDGPIGGPRTSANGKFAGAKFAYEVDFASGSIGRRTEMQHGRWYPTCVELPDGKVVVVQGWDEYGMNNRLVEFYDPEDASWTIRLSPQGNDSWCAGQTQEAYDFSPWGLRPAGSQCYGPGTAPYLTLYPRMHLLPSGLIASVGMGDVDRMYNPNTYAWVSANPAELKRHYGTSVLCPLENTESEKGKILLAGGSPTATTPSTSSCEIAEPSGTSGIVRRSTAPMTYARKHAAPVLLPTGEIVIFGGNLQQSDYNGATLHPEAFDPVTESWTVWAAATVPRMYHQVALLLHDGRVWTAGTTPNISQIEERIEIFNPWYVAETRPTIVGDPIVGTYGETITIDTPDAASISKVSLLKVSSTTHHYNTDQRLIWLQILSKTANTVVVKAPINSRLAPPGMYLLHVLNDASNPVPSVGKFIRVPGVVLDNDLPAQVTGLVATANGASRIDLNWTSNTEPDLHHYNIYRGTSPGFAVVPGVDPPLAQPTASSYSDTGLEQSTTYYYRACAVDTVGNMGTLSDESSATTGAPSYISIYAVTGVNNYSKMYTGNLKRVGVYLHKSAVFNSALIGQPVKKVKFILKKTGNPSGIITMLIRNSANNIIQTFGTIDAATLTNSDQQFERELPSSYTLAANDRVMVEWDGTGSSTDQVWVKRTASNASGWFDGAHTKLTEFKASYSNQAKYDVAGEWFKLG
jgi:hypothetical protein